MSLDPAPQLTQRLAAGRVPLVDAVHRHQGEVCCGHRPIISVELLELSPELAQELPLRVPRVLGGAAVVAVVAL